MKSKNKSKGFALRSHNKITSYKFKIYIQNTKELFEGSITRSEMELIHRLYSTQGANVSLKTLTREFPRYSFIDMQRILRIFNITKNSSALAPHQIEELSEDEAINYLMRIKENYLYKKIEEQKIRTNENKIKQLLIEIDELKEENTSVKTLLTGLDYNKISKIPLVINTPITTGKKDLVIYLSDMHIGAYVNEEGVYSNEYNEQEVSRRLKKIYDFALYHASELKSITVFNLGDAIDGYNASTTRPNHTHILPQNMSNKEMAKKYIELTYYFISQLALINSNISFISVGESNHGGDFEYASTLALKVMLEEKGIKSIVATRPVEYINLGFATYIYLHGKDNINQNKPLPLTLDNRTENLFNEYIIRNKINNNNNIIVIKGDTHQSAMTKGKFFDYKAVGSLFGSSNWIHANFGKTDWCCDYSIFENGYRTDGIINEQN